MEMELSGIINKIKEEGVKEAERRSSEILFQAETKAAEILKEAGDKKEEMLKKAKEEIARLSRNAEDAMKQASRDIVLALRGKLTELFGSVIKEEIGRGMTPDVLKEAIHKIIEGYFSDKKVELEILLSASEKETVEKTLFAALKKDLAKGVTFKVSPHIEHGFRIGKKGENYYYDFTDEAIAEAFKEYLTPAIAKFLPQEQHQKG